MAGFTAAYEEAGFELANPRNQWSAERKDGAVAVTIWGDRIDKSSEPWIYDTRAWSAERAFASSVGRTVLKRHVAGRLATGRRDFALILRQPVDPDVRPRKVKSARHWHQRVGVIGDGEYDAETGGFRMELRPAPA